MEGGVSKDDAKLLRKKRKCCDRRYSYSQSVKSVYKIVCVYDSDNPEEIALDMQKIVEDSNLFTNLVQKGYEISSKINWESTVQNTILAIKTI